jgi:hypothetical protein
MSQSSSAHCTLCNQSFSNAFSLKRHLSRNICHHHCYLCKQLFVGIASYEPHLSTCIQQLDSSSCKEFCTFLQPVLTHVIVGHGHDIVPISLHVKFIQEMVQSHMNHQYLFQGPIGLARFLYDHVLGHKCVAPDHIVHTLRWSIQDSKRTFFYSTASHRKSNGKQTNFVDPDGSYFLFLSRKAFFPALMWYCDTHKVEGEVKQYVKQLLQHLDVSLLDHLVLLLSHHCYVSFKSSNWFCLNCHTLFRCRFQLEKHLLDCRMIQCPFCNTHRFSLRDPEDVFKHHLKSCTGFTGVKLGSLNQLFHTQQLVPPKEADPSTKGLRPSCLVPCLFKWPGEVIDKCWNPSYLMQGTYSLIRFIRKLFHFNDRPYPPYQNYCGDLQYWYMDYLFQDHFVCDPHATELKKLVKGYLCHVVSKGLLSSPLFDFDMEFANQLRMELELEAAKKISKEGV